MDPYNYAEQIALFMKQKQTEIDVPMDVEQVAQKKERKPPKKKMEQIFYVAK